MSHSKRDHRKATLPGAGNPGIAVAGADALVAYADTFLNHVPDDMREQGIFATNNFGNMLGSATNLLLAIELYLKALLLLHGRPAPHTHELPDLFRALTDELQKAVLIAYDNVRTIGPKDHDVIEILPDHGVTAESHPPISDFTLLMVLRRNSNAYVHWRYAFESVQNLKTTRLRYEYVDLRRIAAALRQQFGPMQIQPTRKP